MDKVARIKGLAPRSGSKSGTLYMSVSVPKDLWTAYGSRRLRVSTNTADVAEANRVASAFQAKALEGFDAMRRALHPQPVAKITPELGKRLAEGIRHAVLSLDDDIRDGKTGADLLSLLIDLKRPAPLRIGPPASTAPAGSPDAVPQDRQRDPLAGLSVDEARALAHWNENLHAHALAASASRAMKDVVPMADAQARRLGLLIDWRSPEARPILADCLRAYAGAWADVTARDRGADVPTPPPIPVAASSAAQGAPSTLRDLLPLWKAAKHRQADSERACERALKLFDDLFPRLRLVDITRAHGIDFRAWLLEQVQADRSSSKTAHDRFTWVRGLLTFATDDLQVLPKHPWTRLHVAYRTKSPRRPWTEGQVKAFFSGPLFDAYALPATTVSGHDAAYWASLIALYSGATVSEIAQLRVADVVVDDAVPTLVFVEEGEGQSMKTAFRRRVVPLHSELVRLGFLDYVADVRAAAPAGSLWPHLLKMERRAGHHFSMWFNERRKLEAHAAPVLHALRHTVRSKMAAAGFKSDFLDRITGHAVRGSAGSTVYTHLSAVELVPAIESIRYGGLALPKVYAKGAFKAPKAKTPRGGDRKAVG